MGTSHPLSLGSNNHAITANPNATGASYADIAARDADTAFQITTNINKVVRVESPLSFFILSSIGPAVWVAVAALNPVDTFLELTDTPSSYSGEALKIAQVNAGETALEFIENKVGDVVGPVLSTDDALVRFDLATGKLIKNSVGILTDAGVMSGFTQLNVDSIRIDGNTISSLGLNQDLNLTPNGVGATFTSKDIAIQDANLSIFGTSGSAFIRDIQISTDIISHLSHHSSTAYALQQLASGITSLNAPSGSTIKFKINNTIIGSVDNTGFDFGNLRLSVNTISTENTNGNLLLSPNGTGLIDATTHRIINVVDPTADQDAATKKYVDDQILTQDTFLELTDTPSSYSGQALKIAQVNAGETALEFITNQIGDVVGPGSSADGSVVTFSGVTGKLIQDPAQINLSQGATQNFLTLKVSGKNAIVELNADHTTPLAGQVISNINSLDQSSTGITRQYTSILSQAATTTNTAEDGKLDFLVLVNGINTPLFDIDGSIGSGIVHSAVPVGIGITTPDSLLHVHGGSAGVVSALANTVLTIENDGFQVIQLLTPDAGGHQIAFGIQSDNDRASIFYDTTNGFQFRVAGNQNIMCLDENLRVGIGETVPEARLHVKNATAGTVTALAGTTLVVESNGDNHISLLNPDASTNGVLFGNPTSNVHGGIFYTIADGLQFRTGLNITRMNIQDNGFVAIGDSFTTPDTRLHVVAGPAGTIAAAGGVTVCIESNTNNFIHFKQPNASGGGLLFGDPDVAVAGALSYSTSDQWTWSTINNIVKMRLNAAGDLSIGNPTTSATERLEITSATAVPARILISDSSTHRILIGNDSNVALRTNLIEAQITVQNALQDGAVAFNIAARGNFESAIRFYTSPASPTGLLARMIINEDGQVGIGTTTPDGKLNVVVASSGATADVTANGIVIEHPFNSGMSILSGNTGLGRIFFGDIASPTAASILYNHNNDFMSISSSAAIQLNADESQFLCAISYERTEIADVNKVVLASEYLLAITSITAARTITFNSSVITGSGIPGQAQHWPIKDESGNVSGANTVTIATQSTETIDGATSLVLDTPFFDLVIYSDGNDLFVRSA